MFISKFGFSGSYPTAAVDASPSSSIEDNPSTEPCVTATMGDEIEDTEAGVDDLDDTEEGASATEMLPAIKSTSCNCLCCQNFEIPHQPTPSELEKSKSQSGRQSRSIQTMLSTHGLVYHSSYKIFCHVCCNVKSQNLIHFSSHYNPTFVEGGFPTGRKHYSDLLVMRKVKCTKKLS